MFIMHVKAVPPFDPTTQSDRQRSGPIVHQHTPKKSKLHSKLNGANSTGLFMMYSSCLHYISCCFDSCAIKQCCYHYGRFLHVAVQEREAVMEEEWGREKEGGDIAMQSSIRKFSELKNMPQQVVQTPF